MEVVFRARPPFGRSIVTGALGCPDPVSEDARATGGGQGPRSADARDQVQLATMRIHRPRNRGTQASSSARDRCSQSRRGHGARRAHRTPRHLPCLAAVVRDAASRKRLRYPHDTGIVGPQRCQHDDDLHARVEPWRSGRAKSGGWVAGVAGFMGWRRLVGRFFHLRTDIWRGTRRLIRRVTRPACGRRG